MDQSVLSTIQSWLGTGAINIFGRPFAGKDTQAEYFKKLFGGELLGGGDILRNSTIPKHVDAALRRGELIPSEDYVSIVLPYLSREDFSDKPLLLSSVGRWKGEESGVIEALEQADHPLKAVIYLDIDEDTVHARWEKLTTHDDRGGRYDDTREILDKRLAEYREKTLPVIDAYEQMGLLIHIDGSHDKDTVTHMIISALHKRASEQ